MIRPLILVLAIAAGFAPIAGRAEMLTDDLNGVKIGMTPQQVIAVLKADYPQAPSVVTGPCAAAERSSRTCITSIASGPPSDETSVFFVEEPGAPGTMRVYAAVSITLSQPWTEREQAAWEAVVSRDLGRPDCVQLGTDGRFRAWSRAGAVACAGLPLPESQDLPAGIAGINAGTAVSDRVIWEFQASTGRLHQLVLIDLGYYRSHGGR